MDVPFWKWHHTGRPIYIFRSAHIFPDQYKNVRLPWKWHVSGRLPHTGEQGSLCTYRLLHIYYPRRKHRRKGQPASEAAHNIFRKYCWPRCHQSGGPVCLSDADTFPWQGGHVPWQSHGHGKYCHGTADHLPLRFYRELLQYRESVIRHRIQSRFWKPQQKSDGGFFLLVFQYLSCLRNSFISITDLWWHAYFLLKAL